MTFAHRLCLRLYFSRDADAASLPWALRDASGQVLACGAAGDPWPDATETEVILAAGLTRFERVALPDRQSRKAHGATLGYALEAGLLNAPEDNLYVVSGLDADGGLCVALTAQAPLCRLQLDLAARGYEPERLIPEEMLLPASPPGRWSLAQSRDGWMVRQTPALAVFLPHSAEALADSLGAPPADGLCLFGPVRLPAPWAMTPSRQQPPYDWQSAESAGTVDFADGPLAPAASRRQWRRLGRRFLSVALVLALAETGFCLMEYGALSWRQYCLQRAIQVEAARMAIRGGNLSGQAFERLERVRIVHGAAPRRGVLPLLATLAQATGDGWRVEQLDYRQQRLRVRGGALDARQLRRLRSLLYPQHLALSADPDGQWIVQRAP